MDLMVLDTNLDTIAIIDVYSSFIWTDRYYEYGDFELYMPMNGTILNVIKQDYYIQRRGSDRAMIIEKIEITTDVEDGNNITISGRSLESVLNRRTLMSTETLKGSLQDQIKFLLDECIIDPTDKTRQIPNFIFKASTDPTITSLTLEAQYSYENIYDIIQKICEDNKLGFKITLNDSKQFVFELYSGADRSYDQTALPYVVFSPKMDNLLNSNYIESQSNLKNSIYIEGAPDDTGSIPFASIGMWVPSISGLIKRELYIDGSNISRENKDGTTMSEEEYGQLLLQRAKEAQLEYSDVVSFEGEIDTTLMYVYGEDFFEGDIVQIEDEYGHNSKVRILEVVVSDSEEGTSIYPTFKTVEETEQEGAD